VGRQDTQSEVPCHIQVSGELTNYTSSGTPKIKDILKKSPNCKKTDIKFIIPTLPHSLHANCPGPSFSLLLTLVLDLGVLLLGFRTDASPRG